MPVLCLRTTFRLSAQSRTTQVRPLRKKLTFVSSYRSASECCIRLAYVLVPPVQPAARQSRRFVDRAAEHDQDTNLLTCVESFFSTNFRRGRWGKTRRIISIVCQFFRNTTDRLLAGISTTVSRVRECFCANGSTSPSRSRTPHRESRAFKFSSKASLEGAL